MNLESPYQKWWGFFFKLFYTFIWIFKICLYLCEILITKTLKNESKNTNQNRSNHSILFHHQNFNQYLITKTKTK